VPDDSLNLRRYTAADEDAAIELWRRTWQHHYPHLNFTERVAWWRECWRKELVPVAEIVLAEADGQMIGFVTVDPQTLYLDQIVVAPEHWGSGVALALLDEAKRLSPRGLELLVNKDNSRAIHFYEKHGFVYAGEDKNPVSGKPVNRMQWRGS
jgi:putative acetyltransferase